MGIQRPVGLGVFPDRDQQVKIFRGPDTWYVSQPRLKRVIEIPQSLAADQAYAVEDATSAYDAFQRTNESFIDHGVEL